MVNQGTLWCLGITAATAVGIWIIHEQQTEERQRLHTGVTRDEQMYKVKKQALLAGELQPAPPVPLPQRQ
ncbi:cytochrome c oxidase assembly [Chlorella sorokiniana]|uniref:Cytochrome c oxidase assembly n=1 Tax=Chlorella sorokiniana TaxID=3076 RepID=A0A2P6TU50_CHLSO|nr:cytochrome c oxidase assembly [Chlorella sorokiniana]|eukprot:PRW57602.1 cytochrome c oxidase assembly [Chlorella sorokiniana]